MTGLQASCCCRPDSFLASSLLLYGCNLVGELQVHDERLLGKPLVQILGFPVASHSNTLEPHVHALALGFLLVASVKMQVPYTLWNFSLYFTTQFI